MDTPHFTFPTLPDVDDYLDSLDVTYSCHVTLAELRRRLNYMFLAHCRTVPIESPVVVRLLDNVKRVSSSGPSYGVRQTHRELQKACLQRPSSREIPPSYQRSLDDPDDACSHSPPCGRLRRVSILPPGDSRERGRRRQAIPTATLSTTLTPELILSETRRTRNAGLIGDTILRGPLAGRSRAARRGGCARCVVPGCYLYYIQVRLYALVREIAIAMTMYRWLLPETSFRRASRRVRARFAIDHRME